MLQQDEPDDYVIATGESHTRARVLPRPPSPAPAWTGSDHVRVDARYYRPTEVDHLLGDASKAAGAWAGGPGPASRSWSG